MNPLSVDTLMLCIKAVQRDIAWHEQFAIRKDCSDEDTEYHGEYVLDLSKALSGLSSLYKDVRQGHPGLPELDQLVAGE